MYTYFGNDFIALLSAKLLKNPHTRIYERTLFVFFFFRCFVTFSFAFLINTLDLQLIASFVFVFIY